MRNIKILAKNYAIEYFKTKGYELTQIFSDETFALLQKYGDLKEKCMSKDQRIVQL